MHGRQAYQQPHSGTQPDDSTNSDPEVFASCNGDPTCRQNRETQIQTGVAGGAAGAGGTIQTTYAAADLGSLAPPPLPATPAAGPATPEVIVEVNREVIETEIVTQLELAYAALDAGDLEAFDAVPLWVRLLINEAHGGDPACAARSVDGQVRILERRGDACGYTYLEFDDYWGQDVANFAAGVTDGILFGKGDVVLDAWLSEIGEENSYDSDSRLFTTGQVSGTLANLYAGAGFNAGRIFLAAAVGDDAYALAQGDITFTEFAVRSGVNGVFYGVGAGAASAVNRAMTRSALATAVRGNTAYIVSTVTSGSTRQAFRNMAAQASATSLVTSLSRRTVSRLPDAFVTGFTLDCTFEPRANLGCW